METYLNYLKNSAWLRYVLVLVAGIAIGAIFYPTKRIEERLETKHREEISKITEKFKSEISSLNKELNETKSSKDEMVKQLNASITSLKTLLSESETRVHREYTKIIRVDGSVEIREITDAHSREVKAATEAVAAQWQEKLEQTKTSYEAKIEKISEENKLILAQKETEYKASLDVLSKTKVTTINEKRFGIEAGILTTKQLYGHGTVGLWGPVTVGVHIQGPALPAVGVGVGFKF